MHLKFKLRKGKKDSSIIIELNSINSIRVRVTTKFKIPNSLTKKNWDKDKGRLKILSVVNNSDIINDALEEYEKQIILKLQSLYNTNELNTISAQKLVDEVVNPSKAINEVKNDDKEVFTDFLKYFEHYIEIHKTQVSENSQKLLSKGTLKNLRNVLSVLKRFLKGKNKLGFEQIDKMFINRLIVFINKQGLSLNYRGSIMSKISTVLRASYNDGFHTNTIFNQKIFKKISEEVNHVYLNSEEIIKIRDLKINDVKLNDARDIFIIACYTAMRVGDLINFLNDKEKTILDKGNRRIIYYIQSKTQKEIYAPIHDDIEIIIKRRGGEFPNSIHPNTLNKLVKVIARLAGINETIVMERTMGGEKTKFKKRKYNFITMHTSRRSFCSNANESGWHPEEIMLISGHSSAKVLESYIKSSKEKKVERVIDKDFYKTRKPA